MDVVADTYSPPRGTTKHRSAIRSGRSPVQIQSKSSNKEDDRPVFIFEVNDEADEDLLAIIDDPLVPENMSLCTVECLPGGTRVFQARGDEEPQCSVVYGVRRVDLFEELGLDRDACKAGTGVARATSQLTSRLAEVLNEMYACVLFRQCVKPGGSGAASICCLAALKWRIAVLEDDVIELVLTGQMLAAPATPERPRRLFWSNPHTNFLVPQGIMAINRGECPRASSTTEEVVRIGPRRLRSKEQRVNSLRLLRSAVHVAQTPFDDEYSLQPIVSVLGGSEAQNPTPAASPKAAPVKATQKPAPIVQVPPSPHTPSPQTAHIAKESKPPTVLVSALSAVPHCTVDRYCGLVTVHMIKETVNVTRQYETMQVFYHQFVAEALLSAKAHVLAVGGNALLGYRINNLFLREDKRRAYAVISISGDAAKLARNDESGDGRT